jgi:hypothetical protein
MNSIQIVVGERPVGCRCHADRKPIRRRFPFPADGGRRIVMRAWKLRLGCLLLVGLVQCRATQPAMVQQPAEGVAGAAAPSMMQSATVAPDVESAVPGGSSPRRIEQPVQLPEGVSAAGLAAEQPTGWELDVAAWGVTVQETESGMLRVGEVLPGSPAARAGIAVGAVVSTVDDTVVNGLAHLEGLVEQGGGSVQVEFEPGGTVELPAQ